TGTVCAHRHLLAPIPLNSFQGLGRSMKRIFAASLALLFVPGATFAQQLISPAQLRPVSTRQNPPAEPPIAEAEAAAGTDEAQEEDEKEDALDFLNKDVAEVRQTAVANTAMS